VSPETQAFLAQVRDAEDPSPEVEQRVLLALNAAVAAGALGASAWSASKLVKLLLSGGSAWKLGALGLGVLAATSAVVWPRGEAEAPRPVPVMRAPASVASIEIGAGAAPAPLQTAPEPPKARPLTARPAAATTAVAPSLRAELSLLSRVQAALQRGDANEALRLLDEHRTSDRQLYAERAAARVFALCAAGKTDAARSAASAFAREHPNSLQTSAVARACAEKE
jgi:hypothetical protein